MYKRIQGGTTMKEIFKGRWVELSNKAKDTFKLTDEEITKVEGNVEELSGLIQRKYGYNKERAEKEIQNFLNKHKKPGNKL